MTKTEFQTVQAGDVIRHITTGNSFIVVQTTDAEKRVLTLIRVITAENPDEWEYVAACVPIKQDNLKP